VRRPRCGGGGTNRSFTFAETLDEVTCAACLRAIERADTFVMVTDAHERVTVGADGRALWTESPLW
jgi:hypothetical protein